ncbi:MAG TPA: hypothetical protein VKD90_09925, partial [Gemmataceae bacterium]|nr:hypothetical protein [Gemmataceae bacterium]
MPRKPRVLTLNGKTHTINEWSERTGIPVETIRTRIDVLGKTEAEALTTPVDPRFRRSTGRPSADRPRPCPGLKRHASGQAYVRWKAGGVPFYRYFGDWGSEDAKAGYRRFQVEWADGLATVRTAGHGGATVAELYVAYLKHAERYYQKNGRRTSEVHIVKSAIRELVGWLPDKLIGDVRAGDIDGLRSDLARRKLARATVNKYIGRIQRLFDWGAGQTAQS